MPQNLEVLRDLTESARAAGSLATARGRYRRTPNFTAPAFTSSRPSSDRGTTFHFSHKSKSKGNDVSEGNFNQTTSAAHQGYIERPSATETATENITQAILKLPSDPTLSAPLSTGFHYPDRTATSGRLSFGTLGNTPTQRREFWNTVEHSEAKKARVQNRIIAELPHELSPLDRALVVVDFCQNFEDRCLPYWAALHAPTRKNDARNYHLHITYFDRPSGRSEDGSWDFSVIETRKKKSGNKYTARPYVNAKHPDTRDIHWVKRLRRSYADTVNYYLSLAGVDKRHDPRSYRESGLYKEPTEHLGNKRSALESFGLETEAGIRNAKREIRWHIDIAETPWRERAHAVAAADHLLADDSEEERDALLKIASRGITEARRAASYEITSQLLELRVGRRLSMLEDESNRLRRSDDMNDLARRAETAVALSAEAQIISLRTPEIERLSLECRDQGKVHKDLSDRLERQFDARFSASDPDQFFVDGNESWIEGLDNALALDDDPFSSPDLDEMSIEDLNEITSILADDLFNDSVDITEFDRPDDILDKQEDQKGNEAESTAHEEIKTDTADGLFDDTFGKRKRARIEDIVAAIARGDEPDVPVDGLEKVSREDHPEAWFIEKPANSNDLEKLDRKLAQVTNSDIRFHAIASRDATDLCPPGEAKDAFNRGWLVLRYEAERRGIDLDTGRQHLSRATDKERAAVHTDQDPCPIRIVRKNIARQRVRG